MFILKWFLYVQMVYILCGGIYLTFWCFSKQGRETLQEHFVGKCSND